jgi:hypothetical protein
VLLKLGSNRTHHLGRTGGFFAHWLPTLSATFPLAALDAASSAAVNEWVSALFGEGISDDLTQLVSQFCKGAVRTLVDKGHHDSSSSPTTLLRIAPTICKQCMMACFAGVIDIENLKEGFSYFLQEILSFTLPGVLLWLLSELGRLK